MAKKWTGTKPPRKTLGQALKDIKDAADQDLKALIESAGKDLEVEPAAAGLAYTVNSYPPQGINETPLPRDTGDTRGYVTIEQGTSDLAMQARRAIADVAADASLVNEFGLSTTHGDTLGGRRGNPLDLSDKNEQETFTSTIPDFNVGAVNSFDNSSGLGVGAMEGAPGGFFTAEQIQELLSKIGAEGAFPLRSGHMLLASQAPTVSHLGRPLEEEAGPAGIKIPQIDARTHDQLERYNRYSPSMKSPYVKDPTAGDEKQFFSRGLFSVQVGPGTLGVYNKDGAAVHTVDLRAMALQLMMRAQDHHGLADMIDEAFAKGGASFLYDLAALVPGQTQIGTARISKEYMRIKNSPAAAIRNLVDADGNPYTEPVGLDKAGGSDDFIPTTAGNAPFGVSDSGPTDGTGHALIGPRGSASYGTMNSFIEPFGGPTPMGMLFISVYSVLALSVLGLIIDGIAAGAGADVGPKGVGAQPDPADPSKLQFGRWKSFGGSGLGDMFFELFGFPRLNANFFLCLSKGIERFFDIPSLLDLLSGNVDFSAIMDAATGIALAPGYYATITKQVFRDMEQITEAAVDMAVNISVLNAVVGVFKIIEALFSSFTFRFLIYLSVVGDIDLMSQQGPGTFSQGEFVLPVDHRDALASISPTPFARMRVSRFDLDDTAVGLRSNPLSLTMFPQIILAPEFGQTSQALGDFMMDIESEEDSKDLVTAKGLIVAQDKIMQYLTTIRPGQDQVKAIEDALEIEYMPFYVHDLRTNEIISMPAFISDFSEDFAPEYNESHGYGRTDPVMTYTKTKRNINLTFRLVSFNDRDHEYMWFVINKFVSMCYPSRSAGLKRTFNEGAQHFIQPFSQVPTAAPMIRLRLGEVLHSNYSKRNLARLFGLLGAPGVASIGLDNAALTPDKIKEQKKARIRNQYVGLVKKERKKMLQEIKEEKAPGEKLLIKPGALVYVTNHNTRVKARTTGVFKFKPKEVDKQMWGKKKKYPVYILRGTIKGDTLESGGENEGSLGPAAMKKLKAAQSVPPSAEDAKAALFGIELKVSVCLGSSNLKKVDIDGIVEKAKKERADAAESQKGPDLVKEKDFLNSETNPVVASFNSTRGRGLAGFITALSFDYSQSMWETSEIGSRAPQSVGVTMTFSPIHDLPLGLDAEGHLIAPSHPVGAMMSTDPWDEDIEKKSFKEMLWMNDPNLQILQSTNKLSWILGVGQAEVNKPVKAGD